MNWIWGEKKEEPTKVEFTAKSRAEDIINRTVRIHLDLELNYPYTFDIVQTIKEINADFSLPVGVDIKSVNLTSIELLGGSDVR
jgi:hypothetical protein